MKAERRLDGLGISPGIAIGPVFVTDDNITQCIAEIRRALGEKGPRLLQTLPKRGYVLATEVIQAEAPSSASAVETAAPPTPQTDDENDAAELPPGVPAKPVRLVVLAASLALLLVTAGAGWVYRQQDMGRPHSPQTAALEISGTLSWLHGQSG